MEEAFQINHGQLVLTLIWKCYHWIEFSDNIFVKNIIWTCNLLCKRSRCFHITNKTQETGNRIHKWIPVHASVIYQISWIHWIFVSIRENSNGPRNSVQKTVQNVCDWIHKQPKASVQSMHFFLLGQEIDRNPNWLDWWDWFTNYELKINNKQECIPVGCIPPALSERQRPPWKEHGTRDRDPWKEHGTRDVHCLSSYKNPSPLWTEWLTDRCKNITFPQLCLRDTSRRKTPFSYPV